MPIAATVSVVLLGLLLVVGLYLGVEWVFDRGDEE